MSCANEDTERWMVFLRLNSFFENMNFDEKHYIKPQQPRHWSVRRRSFKRWLLFPLFQNKKKKTDSSIQRAHHTTIPRYHEPQTIIGSQVFLFKYLVSSGKSFLNSQLSHVHHYLIRFNLIYYQTWNLECSGRCFQRKIHYLNIPPCFFLSFFFSLVLQNFVKLRIEVLVIIIRCDDSETMNYSNKLWTVNGSFFPSIFLGSLIASHLIGDNKTERKNKQIFQTKNARRRWWWWGPVFPCFTTNNINECHNICEQFCISFWGKMQFFFLKWSGHEICMNCCCLLKWIV